MGREEGKELLKGLGKTQEPSPHTFSPVSHLPCSSLLLNHIKNNKSLEFKKAQLQTLAANPCMAITVAEFIAVA